MGFFSSVKKAFSGGSSSKSSSSSSKKKSSNYTSVGASLGSAFGGVGTAIGTAVGAMADAGHRQSSSSSGSSSNHSSSSGGGGGGFVNDLSTSFKTTFTPQQQKQQAMNNYYNSLVGNNPNEHAKYIEDNKVGGGLQNYINTQNQKYLSAVRNNDYDMMNRIKQDSQRVGYQLNGQNTSVYNPNQATNMNEHAKYIEDNKIGGGLQNYIKIQNQRYANAISNNDYDTINKLKQDAQRVGFDLNTPKSPIGNPLDLVTGLANFQQNMFGFAPQQQQQMEQPDMQEYMDDYMKTVEAQTKLQYDPMLTAIQNKLNSSLKGVEDERSTLDKSFTDTKGAIDSRAYEDMERMKQAMANRGLFSSGIYNANEQQVRQDKESRIETARQDRDEGLGELRRRIALLRENSFNEMNSINAQKGAFMSKGLMDAKQEYMNLIRENQKQAEDYKRWATETGLKLHGLNLDDAHFNKELSMKQDKVDFDKQSFDKELKFKYEKMASDQALEKWQTEYKGNLERELTGARISASMARSGGRGGKSGSGKVKQLNSFSLKAWEGVNAKIEDIMGSNMSTSQQIRSLKQLGNSLSGDVAMQFNLDNRLVPYINESIGGAISEIQNAKGFAEKAVNDAQNNFHNSITKYSSLPTPKSTSSTKGKKTAKSVSKDKYMSAFRK